MIGQEIKAVQPATLIEDFEVRTTVLEVIIDTLGFLSLVTVGAILVLAL